MTEALGTHRDTILIVDDEAIVLRVASTMMASTGFRVVVAESGTEGLPLFRQHRDSVALVLVDVEMPGMTGIEMANRILEIEPAARILFMSGYSDAELKVEAQMRYPFIRKPFLPADLVQKVRKVLGQAAGSAQ